MGMGMGMGMATGTEDSRCSWDRRVCGSMQLVRIFPWRLLCATATSAAATSTLTTSATGECRYQVLSAALCFFFFFVFLLLFGTTHFNDESSGVAVPPIHYEFRL